jgi:hypothetical protein
MCSESLADLENVLLDNRYKICWAAFSVACHYSSLNQAAEFMKRFRKANLVRPELKCSSTDAERDSL